jgi:hypothetical protein
MKNCGIETGSRKVLNWDTQNLYKCLAILKIACYKRLEDRYLIKYVSDLWQVGSTKSLWLYLMPLHNHLFFF